MKLKTLYQTAVVLGVVLVACCGLALWRNTTGVASATTMNLHTFPEFFNEPADLGVAVFDNRLAILLTIGVVALLMLCMNNDFSKSSDEEYVRKFR